MNFPENILYTKDHEWLKIEGDFAFIGITDFAQSELGDIVFVELPKVETKIEKEKPFGTIEAVKAVSDLFAPINGKVVEVNNEIAIAPDLVNKDPYEKGWMIKVLVENISEVDLLLNVADYKKQIGQ